MEYQTIYFYEEGYSVRTLETEEDHFKAYRLRHEVFCETLRWVPPHPGGLEFDRYDPFATSLGLFSDEGTLLGFIRFLPPDRSYMLETDFADLVSPQHKIRKEADTMEISRLAVSPSARTHEGLWSRYLGILLKGLYQWTMVNQIRYSYIEVEERFWRLLHILGFPSTPIGPARALPPAEAKSIAAVIDWEEFRVYNRSRRPAFLDWMATVQSAAVGWQGQWHGRGSRPEVLQGSSGRENSPFAR